MNAPFAMSRETVRTVDLRQPDEAARIEGFVAAMGGSVFHRPAWLRAVERGTGQRARGLVAEKGGAVEHAPAHRRDEPFDPRRLVGLAQVGGADIFARQGEWSIQANAPVAAVSASILAASR